VYLVIATTFGVYREIGKGDGTMWKMFRCFVRRFNSDPHLEELLKRNREALEEKRREVRLAAHAENLVIEELRQSA